MPLRGLACRWRYFVSPGATGHVLSTSSPVYLAPMKAKPPTPTALKVPDWLLKEAEGYVSGATTRHAVLLAMMALGARALREDSSLLSEAIEQTRKPRRTASTSPSDVDDLPLAASVLSPVSPPVTFEDSSPDVSISLPSSLSDSPPTVSSSSSAPITPSSPSQGAPAGEDTSSLDDIDFDQLLADV